MLKCIDGVLENFSIGKSGSCQPLFKHGEVASMLLFPSEGSDTIVIVDRKDWSEG